MVLYINSCVREQSRTHILAKALLQRLGDYQEVTIENTDLAPLDKETLARRMELIRQGDYTDPMLSYARQFAAADTIVISAPFWDLSFPALLKTYIENIYVVGLVTKYGIDGTPKGLCKAKDLYYVTTAGGKFDARYGYGYIRDLAQTCFGITNTHLIYAEMLDIDGYDADAIMVQKIHEIQTMELP